MYSKNLLSSLRVVKETAILAVLILSSCSAVRMEQAVSPPATPPLSRSIGYAVIVSSYVQVRDTPATAGVSLGYYRRGAVVPIEERRSVRTDEGAQIWLLNGGAEKGWILEREVDVYDNEAKALTAAKGLPK